MLVDLGNGNYTATLDRVSSLVPSVPVVGVTLARDREPIVAAAIFSVRAFVGCEQSLDELIDTVRRAATHEVVCPPSVAEVLLERVKGQSADVPEEDLLTRREREVALLMARGMTNKEIATSLVVQPATVKNHVHSILSKLQIKRRGEAAAALAHSQDRSAV